MARTTHASQRSSSPKDDTEPDPIGSPAVRGPTEDELRRLLDLTPDALWSAVRDPSGRWSYLHLSRAFEPLTGRPLADLAAGPDRWWELLHPDDRDRARGEYDHFLDAGEGTTAQEYRIVRPDGSACWVRNDMRVSRDDAGRACRLDGVARDVSSRKQAESALRESEERFAAFMEYSPASAFLKDQAGRYVFGSRAWAAQFGKPAAELLGRTDADLWPPDAARLFQASDRVVLDSGRAAEAVETVTGPDGRAQSWLVLKFPLRDAADRRLLGGIAVDLSEHARLEAELRQAQKLEAVGRLAGGIAHDFNNLLTAIIGNLALVELPAGNANAPLLGAAQAAAARAADLTAKLLGFARRRPLHPGPVKLSAVAVETVGILRRTFDPRVEVTTAGPPDEWPALADASLVSQVLMNLCLNARDAMPGGGRIAVSTANVELDAVAAARHSDARPGAFVRLRVADTGAGMAPEVRQRVFEPFFTTKPAGQGTGLGLAMVYGIARQHQGWIEVESEPGRGTRFDVYLPRAPVADLEPATAAAAPAEVTPAVRGTVLLVDDEPLVSQFARAVLEQRGYRVIGAADGAAAVETYTRRGREIDLVVLDLAMPRLAGPDTLRRLVELDPGVRVVVSSGHANLSAELTASPAVRGVLPKPYRPADLLRVVADALTAR